MSLPSRELMAEVVLCAAVLFNLALALVNANVFALSRSTVILSEVMIVGAAIGICLTAVSRPMIPWAAILWMLTTLFVALSLARSSVEPKYFRDVLLIPVFIALGIAYSRGNIVRLFCVLQAIILVFVFFEGLFPVLFGDVFNPTEYYVNTRGYRREVFWAEESNLFVSSHRPGDRFLFGWLGIHRLSSVFIEPVSLGNWCILMLVFTLCLWRSMSLRVRAYLVLSTFIILVGSDGRLATGTMAVILVASIVARWLPRYIYFLYLPAVILASVLLVASQDINHNMDNFLGRIAYGIWMLSNFDLAAFLGVNLPLIEVAADSGLSYFLLTQSIFGLVLLWTAICVLQPPHDRQALVLMHGVCIYIAFCLMVSYSLFSIKTAAPLWFLYGYMSTRGWNQTKASEVSRTASAMPIAMQRRRANRPMTT